MNFGGVFVENNQKKVTDAQLRASKKYANSKYRPNVYMAKEMETVVLKRIDELGYKSFNEYACALVEYDLLNRICPIKKRRMIN